VLSALLPPAVAAGGTEAMRARLRDPDARAALRAQAERGGIGDGAWVEADPAGVLLTGHRDPGVVGRTLAEVAGGRDPWDALCDPATVGHDGTYLDPDVPVSGIEHVVLAGDLVVEPGQLSGRRSGRVLRRAGGSTAAPR
jgi:N-acyl-D-aspartate/D-glutamate deacylase